MTQSPPAHISHPELDEFLHRARVERRLPSVVAAVTNREKVLWSAGSGATDGITAAEPNLGTRYRIGSITKTMVGVQILRMRDEGLLSLGDQIGQYWSAWPFGQLTIAQLLSHTSGLQAETGGPWWERSEGADWPTLLSAELRLVNNPGTRFHYSNLGFAVLGELIAQLRSAPWWQVLTDEIWGPLGMTETSYHPGSNHAVGLAVHPTQDLVLTEPATNTGAMAPAGQVWSSIRDLARWNQFSIGATDPVLSTDTLAEMQVPFATEDAPDSRWERTQGLGWALWNLGGGRRYVGHGGSMPGFVALIMSNLDSSLGLSLMTNSTAGFGNLPDQLLQLATEAFGHQEATGTEAATVPLSSDLERYLGDWFWGPTRFTLSAVPEGLKLSEATQRRSSRFVQSADGWVGLDTYFAGETLRFTDEGAIEVATFVLSREPYDPKVKHPGGVDPQGWRNVRFAD